MVLRTAALFGAGAVFIFCSTVFSVLIGKRFLRTLAFESSAEQFAYSGAFGLAIAGNILYALGLSGVLSIAGAATALGGLALWSLARSAREPRVKFNLTVSRKTMLLAAVCLVTLAPLFILALYPPTAFDATLYHLPLARRYAETHAIRPAFEIRYSYFPQLNEVLFTVPLLLRFDLGAHLIELLMMALLGVAIFGVGARIGGKRAGLWTAALWFSSELAIDLGTTALVDMGLALFSALSVFAVLRWRESNDIRWLTLAGAMAGFAASTKYSGLITGAVLGTLILVTARDRWRASGAFAWPATVAALPWYIRTLWITGNPVYPFLGSIFGVRHGPMDAADLESHRRMYVSLVPSFLSDPTGFARKMATYCSWLLGRPLPGVILITLAFLLIYGCRADKRIRLVVLVALGQTLFLFQGFGAIRFPFPVVPLLLLAVGCTLSTASRFLDRGNRSWNRFLTVAVALAIALPGIAVVVAQECNAGSPPPDPSSRASYLSQVDGYAALHFLKVHSPKPPVTYNLYAERDSYFAPGRYLGDSFGPFRSSDVIDRLEQPTELARMFKARGAQFFLIDKHSFFRVQAVHWSPPASYLAHFQKVYEDDSAILYQIR